MRLQPSIALVCMDHKACFGTDLYAKHEYLFLKKLDIAAVAKSETQPLQYHRVLKTGSLFRWGYDKNGYHLP